MLLLLLLQDLLSGASALATGNVLDHFRDVLLIKGTAADILTQLKQPIPVQFADPLGSGLVLYAGVVVCLQLEGEKRCGKDWALGHTALAMVMTALFWQKLANTR